MDTWVCPFGARIKEVWLYGISALIPQTSFPGEISHCVAKCRLFSQARVYEELGYENRWESSIETDDNNKHWMCQSTVLGARSTSLCKLHLKQNVLSFTYVPAGAGVCNLYKGLLIASLLHLAQHSRGSYHTFSYCLRPGKWNKHLCEKKRLFPPVTCKWVKGLK